MGNDGFSKVGKRLWQLEKLGCLAARLERKHWNDHLKEVRLEVHGPPFLSG